jgi:hypothetical protein
MLSRRWLINYFLLVLIIIFTWIGMKYPVTDEQRFDRDAITRIKPQQIETIRIQTADASISLEKKDGRWFIAEPFLWFADNIAAERLASLASAHAQSSLPSDEIDLSTLGLSIPRAVVTLNQQAIQFGGVNQIGNRRYLRVNDTVYLVDDIHFAFINQGLAGLVDKRLLPAGSGLRGLTSSGFELSLQQGQWLDGNGESDKAKALIDNWQSIAAARIQAYDSSFTPLQKIRAEFDDGGDEEFFLLSIQPEIIIARPKLKLQYHFPEQQYYELLSLDDAPEQ